MAIQTSYLPAPKYTSENKLNLGTLLHDLENPLTLAQFNLDILYTKISTSKKLEYVELLAPALSTIHEMSEMIINLKKDSNYAPYSAKEEIQDIVENYRFKCQQESIVLKIQLDKDKILYQYREEFRSIITNILTNAMTACKGSGKQVNFIFIKTIELNGKLKIIIRDNGIGMSGAEVTELFHNKRRTFSGMNIVYSNLTKLFKGEIKVVSKKYYGTEFTIKL